MSLIERIAEVHGGELIATRMSAEHPYVEMKFPLAAEMKRFNWIV